MVLDVSGNPDLGGVMTQSLVLQCERIAYDGCKQKYPDCGGRNEEFMQGPFLVGASFASEVVIRNFQNVV